MISSQDDRKSADLILLIGYLSIYIEALAQHLRAAKSAGEKGLDSAVDKAMAIFYDYVALRHLIELNFSYPCITSKLHAQEISRIEDMLTSLDELAQASYKINNAAAREYAAARALIKKYYVVTPKETTKLGEDSYLMHAVPPHELYPDAFPDQAALYSLAQEYSDELNEYKSLLAKGE